MTLDEFKAVSPVFEEDIYEAISLKTCVEKRAVIGAPGRTAMEQALTLFHQQLDGQRTLK